MNRRQFVQGWFAGAAVLGTSGFHRDLEVRLYHKYDHYVAPGKFNVWLASGKEWLLLSDNQDAPFEFDDKDKAEEFCRKMGLRHYSELERSEWDRTSEIENFISIRPAPSEIDKFEGYGLFRGPAIDETTLAFAERNFFGIDRTVVAQIADHLIARGPRSVLDFKGNKERFQAAVMLGIIMGPDKGNNSEFWCFLLKQKEAKRMILPLQKNERFCYIIRDLYCGGSFQTCLAKLHVFCPIRSRLSKHPGYGAAVGRKTSPMLFPNV